MGIMLWCPAQTSTTVGVRIHCALIFRLHVSPPSHGQHRNIIHPRQRIRGRARRHHVAADADVAKPQAADDLTAPPHAACRPHAPRVPVSRRRVRARCLSPGEAAECPPPSREAYALGSGAGWFRPHHLPQVESVVVASLVARLRNCIATNRQSLSEAGRSSSRQMS